MPEDLSEQQQIEQLATRVAERVIDEKVYASVLGQLLGHVRSDVHKVVLEALLLYRGRISRARDQEWARTMAHVWQPSNNDSELPGNPHELQELILGWQQGREQDLRLLASKQGVQQGFRQGIVEGCKLGFGGATMGKTLDDVLRASENKKPSL